MRISRSTFRNGNVRVPLPARFAPKSPTNAKCPATAMLTATASPSANIGAAPRRSPRAPKRGLQPQDSSPRTRSKTSQKLRAAGVPAEVELAAEDEYDEEYQPQEVSDVEEEYDEGKIVDDERPPFDDEPAKADPELIDELQKAAEDAAEGEEYEPKEAESEVEEEYDEADAVPDAL